MVFVPGWSATVGLFDPSSNTFTRGPSVGSAGQHKFWGGVLLSDGRVVFVHNTFAKVGLFDPSTNTITSGPNVGSGRSNSWGGVLLPDGRVVFVPRDSATVGMFDPSIGTSTTCTRKPAYTLSQPLPPSWNVALLPYYNKY